MTALIRMIGGVFGRRRPAAAAFEAWILAVAWLRRLEEVGEPIVMDGGDPVAHELERLGVARGAPHLLVVAEPLERARPGRQKVDDTQDRAFDGVGLVPAAVAGELVSNVA